MGSLRRVTDSAILYDFLGQFDARGDCWERLEHCRARSTVRAEDEAPVQRRPRDVFCDFDSVERQVYRW